MAAPAPSTHASGVDEPLQQARAVLTRIFGYPDFRGRQAEAVSAVLAGRDLLVLMPTGMGKSLH